MGYSFPDNYVNNVLYNNSCLKFNITNTSHIAIWNLIDPVKNCCVKLK